jgi:AcrR family transcriptional regulator
MGPAGHSTRTYSSERRAAQAQETRRRILRIATAAFLEQGYVGTTLRMIATRAGVSLPTVEASFGTKPGLLKAAIDVAIAGDDRPVPMVERQWAVEAQSTTDPRVVLALAGDVIVDAQSRSAGLVLAAFEGAPASPELGALADQLAGQRAVTARWIVDALVAKAPLRASWTASTAADLVWILMDPAVYVRLVRDRGWTPEAYRDWWVSSVALLIDVSDPPADRAGDDESRRT